ncbi:MAG TPA: hypothetical protein VLF94_06255 [Chlamydiales bacterium]|nr:hypothetical protein [Chlamydiales bacterium]
MATPVPPAQLAPEHTKYAHCSLTRVYEKCDKETPLAHHYSDEVIEAAQRICHQFLLDQQDPDAGILNPKSREGHPLANFPFRVDSREQTIEAISYRVQQTIELLARVLATANPNAPVLNDVWNSSTREVVLVMKHKDIAPFKALDFRSARRALADALRQQTARIIAIEASRCTASPA